MMAILNDGFKTSSEEVVPAFVNILPRAILIHAPWSWWDQNVAIRSFYAFKD